MLTYAKDLANEGFIVVPLHSIRHGRCSCEKPLCPKPGKHPRVIWSLIGHNDLTLIDRWWEQWPDANLGVLTGPSKLVVLDCDSPDAVERFRDIKTRRSKTSRGEHLWFSGEVPSSVCRIGPHVDVRSKGGLVVAPPSKHITGIEYEWLNSEPLAVFPMDLIAVVRSNESPAWNGHLVPEGARHRELLALDRYLIGRGFGPEQRFGVLVAFRDECCEEGYTTEEIATMILADKKKFPLDSDLLQKGIVR